MMYYTKSRFIAVTKDSTKLAALEVARLQRVSIYRNFELNIIY